MDLTHLQNTSTTS